MQILGLYNGNYGNIRTALKELHNAQLFLPIVLILKRQSFIPYYSDHTTIFPMFYSVDRRATMHQLLAQSFGKDQGRYMVTNTNNIRTFNIYLTDSSEIPSISVLAKNMAVSFPQIGYLNFFFESRCEIVSFLFSYITVPDLKMYYFILLAITED